MSKEARTQQQKRGRITYHYDRFFKPPKPYANLDLLQIGTSYFQPCTAVALHTHVGFFELTAVTAGKGKISANNVTVPVEQGDIFISFPYDTHSIEADETEGMNYHFCAFFLKDEALLGDLEQLSVRHAKTAERIIRSDTVQALLATAIAETGKEHLHQKQYLEAVFTQMIIQVIRTFCRQSSRPVTPSKRQELCFCVMDYINTHIYSIASLGEIADHLGYDYTYLSKIFTKTTGQSISDYYRFQRLEVSRTLIHEGVLTMTEIAERLQYASIYSFSKSFKKQYGVSPREYQKKREER